MTRPCAVLASLLVCSSASASAPAAGTSPEATKCPDQVAWTGLYENSQFGFSVQIPEGLSGYWNSARCSSANGDCVCMGDHGRIVPLTKDRDEPRHIEAYAGYNALLFESPEQAATEHLKWIRDDPENSRVAILQRTKTSLAALKAERAVVKYYNKKLKTWMIEDRIDALDGNMEYTLYLRTREANYQQDRAVFEAVLKSFKRIPAEG